MKILYIAEIVGKAGIYAFKNGLGPIKKRYKVDFVIACADGATGGNGLGRNHAAYLHKLGANVLTTGDCCFYKKDLVENLGRIHYVLRPENLNPHAPGVGFRHFSVGEEKAGLAVLIGQSGFNRIHGENPIARLPALLEQLYRESPYVVVDFHAWATGEKRAVFAALDGRCSAIIGSHGRVQTADEAILPGGTAVITDAGRTGSINSVGGADTESRIQEYLTGIPDWTKDAWDMPEIQGVLIDINREGKALSIERIRYAVPPPSPKKPAASGEKDDSAPPEEVFGDR
ncbi:MAG: YmdB family metallophosphoesterase [Treponema sp.]|jgi:metallophosphoesterase (TIGR00282 family)|nr:YmdB family metallophosphoesterase [Treponema sp.]